jgi:hypothetical protein
MADKKSEFESDFEPAFQFVPEEDDDWREEQAPVEQLVLTGAGDWIKPADLYHARGADLGQIQKIRGQNAEILWATDGVRTNMFIGDIYPVKPPSMQEVGRLRQIPRSQAVAACSDRLDPNPSAQFKLGTLVLTRAIQCRHGVQLGTVIEVLSDDRYRVEWQHVIGIRPKDSRTSFCPDWWRRCQLLAAELSWHQLGKSKKALGAYSPAKHKR